MNITPNQHELPGPWCPHCGSLAAHIKGLETLEAMEESLLHEYRPALLQSGHDRYASLAARLGIAPIPLHELISLRLKRTARHANRSHP